jgi:triacylglycerol esterase/lipase EstA (alpha/beta hydrolase family)
MERVGRPGIGAWTGLAPRRRLLLAGILALAILAGVAVAVRGCAGRSGGPPEQSRPGPVLLVPGYGGSRSALSGLADRIRATGRAATVLTLPGDGTGDLAADAAELDRAVSAELGRGAPSVDVVGYSAGGVAVRLWIARYATARHAARRIVTLGSPLHGARLAATGAAFAPDACPTACQQLVPGSALLRELDRSPVPAGLPWLSIWTSEDQTVVPPDSARLAGAVNVPVQSVCADAHVAHGQLPTDPLVTGLVLRALGAAAPTTPGPADCPALRALGA